jgi:hypothetical protein
VTTTVSAPPLQVAEHDRQKEAHGEFHATEAPDKAVMDAVESLGTAALLARPQSHRASLRKTQNPHPKTEERTVDGLWRRIGGSLEAFTPRECANYLRNAGYAST